MHHKNFFPLCNEHVELDVLTLWDMFHDKAYILGIAYIDKY